jgi:hypothetical protein
MKQRNILIQPLVLLFVLSPVVMAQTAPTDPTSDKLVVTCTGSMMRVFKIWENQIDKITC